MKEVTVVAYCDGDHEDRRTAVAERTVSVDGSKPVLLDLCGDCDKLIVGLLMLMEHGTVMPKAKAKEPTKEPTKAEDKPTNGDHICPECGFKSASREALGQHLRTQHGKGFRDLKKAS